MSAEGTLPPAGPPRRPLRPSWLWLLAAGLLALAFAAGWRLGGTHTVALETAPDGRHVALAREVPCLSGRCQALWIGESWWDLDRVAALAAGDRCEEIAWTADGERVAFLVNGYRLRLFDAEARHEARQVDLIAPAAAEAGRFVRGVTFSQNGRAVTFDECPRDRSGCRSGFAGVP
jgi:hypothetical protein